MSRLLNFETFTIISESNEHYSNELDSLTERLIDAITSPLKYRKVKAAGKKLQKALATKAMVDVDFIKKSKGLPVEKKNLVKAAGDAKKAAYDETISALNQSIDDAATTDGLKAMAAVTKTTARLSAAEVTLKGASKAEAKAINKQVKKLQKAKQEATKDLATQEANPKEDKEAAASIDKEKKVKTDAEDTAKSDANKEKVEDTPTDKESQIEASIAAINKNIESERSRVTSLKKTLEAVEADQAKSTDASTYDTKIAKIKKDIEDSNEDIKELNAQEGKLKKQLSAESTDG